MSEKLPRMTPDEMIYAVSKLGYFFSRQSGSHKIYKNVKGVRITIPYHKGRILHPKIVKSIIIDIGIGIKDFRKLL